MHTRRLAELPETAANRPALSGCPSALLTALLIALLAAFLIALLTALLVLAALFQLRAEAQRKAVTWRRNASRKMLQKIRVFEKANMGLVLCQLFCCFGCLLYSSFRCFVQYCDVLALWFVLLLVLLGFFLFLFFASFLFCLSLSFFLSFVRGGGGRREETEEMNNYR